MAADAGAQDVDLSAGDFRAFVGFCMRTNPHPRSGRELTTDTELQRYPVLSLVHIASAPPNAKDKPPGMSHTCF